MQEIEYTIFYIHKQYQRWCSILEEIKTALELLATSPDEQLLQEAQANLAQLQQELETAEIRALLTNSDDQKGAFLTIKAESDDADGQEWAYILLKMYYQWANKHNYQIHLLEESGGDVSGIKSATCEITGLYAYGFLKSELGIHQLQRLSPFETSGNLRTSLARVEVSPILDESIDLVIPDQDLQITRWQWHGQNINHPEIWVRVVHIPSGITVFCEQERSQLENKKQALAILKSKLVAIALAQGVKSIADIQPGEIKSLSSQIIREYVLHPYTKVKDLRTKVETTNVQDVWNGDIDFLIKAYLQQQSYMTVEKSS
ncbi:peptide chain release factor 2 [Nostoc sp. CENA543]|nr:peptide chain release factor 2 [Nostoc sp. CENA543]